MRAQLNRQDLASFFSKIEKRLDDPWAENVATICGVQPRTVRDWRRGKYTIPVSAIHSLVNATGVKTPTITKQLDRYWYAHKGARLGALKRFELYGQLGTPEGRRNGGLRSILVNKKLKKPGFNVKKIKYPAQSTQLAEFTGAVLGDGSVTPYQISITVHRVDEREYANHIARLGKRLFGISPTLSDRSDHNTRTAVFSSKRLVRFFGKQDIPIGDKVRHQVMVPQWIRSSSGYSSACLRGLMDTDGCFYVDRHRYKNKVYHNATLHFSNHSIPLLEFVEQSFKDIGLHSTTKTRQAVFLRREDEIAHYFTEIGSSNPKHERRYKHYRKMKQGEVPKWS